MHTAGGQLPPAGEHTARVLPHATPAPPSASVAGCVRRRRCWEQGARHSLPQPWHGKASVHVPHVHAASAASDPPAASQPLTQLIADVLTAENKARQASPQQGDLLSTVDALGGRALTATVSRSWEGQDAWLEVQGSWPPHCEEARKFALLAAYHERLWVRNQQLARLFQLVVQHRPGVLPTASVDRVSSSIALNGMSGATEALQLPELLLLGVACLSLATLEQALVAAADQCWQQIKAQAWATRDGMGGASVQGQLSVLRAAWRYQLSMALIRLHHMPGITATSQALARLKQQAQQNSPSPATRSLWLSSSSSAGDASEGGSSPASSLASVSAEDRDAAAAANFVAGQLGAFVKEGLTGPHCGRPGLVGFGRGGFAGSSGSRNSGSSKSGSSNSGSSSGSSSTRGGGQPLLGGGGLARGALVRDPGAEGAAGFGAAVLREFRDVYAADRDQKAARSVHKSLLQGAAVAYERCLRGLLLDVLCGWAEGQPQLLGLKPLAPHCTHSTRIRSGSKEHVSRVISISVPGSNSSGSGNGTATVAWLRQQAVQQGAGLLQGWDRHLGNPFNNSSEWEYRSEAPVVWNRLTYLPPSLDLARITLFWRQPPGSSSAAAPTTPTTSTGRATHEQASITLSQSELQAFMAALLAAVPTTTSLAAGGFEDLATSGSGASLTHDRSRASPLNGPMARLGRSQGASQPGEWLGPGQLQLRYNPLAPGHTFSAALSAAADPSQVWSDFEVRWVATPDAQQQQPQQEGTVAGTASQPAPHSPPSHQIQRLTLSHIQSLLNIYEDVSARLPEILPVPATPTHLTLPAHSSAQRPTPWPQRLLGAAVKVVGVLALAAAIPMAIALRSPGSVAHWAAHPSIAWLRNALPAAAVAARPAARPTHTAPDSPAEATSTWPASAADAAGATAAAPAATAATAAGGPTAAAASQGRPNALQPLRPEAVDTDTLERLCRRVKDWVDGTMWLPLTPQVTPGTSQVTPQATTAAGSDGDVQQAGSQQQQQQQQQQGPLLLSYQVVVSRQDGRVLGCMPCDTASATWYSHLPLSTHMRSGAAQKQQARFLDACQPDATKQQLPGSFPRLSSYAQYTPLPRAAPAVPAGAAATSTATTAAAAAAPGAADVPSASPSDAGPVSNYMHGAADAAATAAAPAAPADVVVLALRLVQDPSQKATLGSGKSACGCAPMVAQVTPWTDLDSVTTWAAHSAVVVSRRGVNLQPWKKQPPPPQQSSVKAAADDTASALQAAVGAGQQAEGSSSSMGLPSEVRITMPTIKATDAGSQASRASASQPLQQGAGQGMKQQQGGVRGSLVGGDLSQVEQLLQTVLRQLAEQAAQQQQQQQQQMEGVQEGAAASAAAVTGAAAAGSAGSAEAETTGVASTAHASSGGRTRVR